jgi:HpiC1 cyclase
MGKRVIYLISLVLLAGSVAQAATIHWTGLGGDKLWSNRANWELNKVPTLADEAYIDIPPAKAPNGPVIQDGIDAKALGLGCEVAGEPNMTMTGGTLEIADWIWWGDGRDCHGTFNMSGGTITVGAEHELGWDGGTGTWIMTGGTVTAGELVIPTSSGAAGQLYLHGGVYNVGSDGLSMTATGLIDVGGGTLILEGDQTAKINGFIAAGQITFYGGGGLYDLDYNDRNPGKTTLTATWTGKAYNPDPPDGSYHSDTWANLSWSPDAAAVSHDVYVGDDSDHVNDGTGGTFRANQVTTYFVVGFPGYPYPDGLVPGTTYYWRIDEIQADGTTCKGDVWSFTVPPKTAYNPDPANGAESVDPKETLNWAAGFGAKLHTVYIGKDYDDVNDATGGLPQGTTTYDPGPLKAEKLYYWRVDEFDGSATYKGDVWSFTTPGAVGTPKPANGAVDVKQTQILSWKPADHAASHQVYFGTDKEAVRSADMTSPQCKGDKPLGSESFDPGKLAWQTTYYWRVDEVNSLNPDSPWKGPLWSFTTADFIVVDDFEDYDVGNNEIWWAWKDGLGYAAHDTEPAYPGNGTGSAVGDETTPSYTEETIVHGGRQSMPLSYDNNKQGYANYSQVERTLSYPRDWTEQGVSKLVLWFRGRSSNSAERLYVAISNSTGAPAVVYHDDAGASQIRTWTKWVIPLSAFADQGIDLSDVEKIAVGIGTQGNTTTLGGSGKMYFDDVALYPPESVRIENFSFELPGTEKQKGFDNVPGWNTDGPCSDSGVETSYTPTDGSWTAYLMSGDPALWQLTDRTIKTGNVFKLKVDARITWAATTLRMTLYYDDNGTRIAAASSDVALSDAMQQYSLSFSADDVPESVGHRIGVEFSNVSSADTWVGLDNVRLEAGS